MTNGKKRILVTTGGTGGHIFPALSVAEEMRRLGHAVLFVGRPGGLEETRAKAMGFEFKGINIEGFDRGSILKSIKSLFMLPRAVSEATKGLEAFKPHAVVGCGGYAAAPSCIAAVMKGVPLFLLEQNVYPGLVTRRLAHRAKKVYASFPETGGYLGKGNMVVAGNPSRREFAPSKNRDFRAFEKTLLVIGGSQGARSINRAMITALPMLKGLNLRIIHQTGERDLEEVRGAYAKHMPPKVANSAPGTFSFEPTPPVVEPFFEDMAEKMRSAHLAVARAGASSCAELLLTGLPAVLIPFPGAGGHQKFNAMSLENCGAATVIDDADLRTGILTERIAGLVKSAERLERMSSNGVRNSKPGAARVITTDILSAIGG